MYFIDWSVNYWKLLPPGISDARHGMAMKLSPKKLLHKKWVLMISSVGSHDKSPFYKPENKINIFVITEETGLS